MKKFAHLPATYHDMLKVYEVFTAFSVCSYEPADLSLRFRSVNDPDVALLYGAPCLGQCRKQFAVGSLSAFLKSSVM